MSQIRTWTKGAKITGRCGIPNCDRNWTTKGMCASHYQRWVRGKVGDELLSQIGSEMHQLPASVLAELARASKMKASRKAARVDSLIKREVAKKNDAEYRNGRKVQLLKFTRASVVA